MRTDTGKTIYRHGWQPFPYSIKQLELSFDLDPELTTVRSRFTVLSKSNEPQSLELNGEQLSLISLHVNGNELDPSEYTLTDTTLCIPLQGPENLIEISNTCNPSLNTTLMGLYASGTQLFTQCEPEGFRRITWFADRPDVMTRYRVSLTADKDAYPLLLSNGNLLSHNELENNRHQMIWEDPFPKPSYLFAVVAGDFDCQERRLRTSSGREVLLQVYSDKGDGSKTLWALDSLERSLRWDEKRFGLELDLDRYMIVATHDFNMGAMENKGLNVFNAAYVLADPQTTTDTTYRDIEAVIGHEYFHNWTGNRITCRDWFQLSLKEGLTVFREQEFSADMMAEQLTGPQAASAKAVKRIDDVSTLRIAQFPEDAGPMAHPIRPESYEEISNFYTATIYEKGAEVIRMLHTLLGEALFQQGMQAYIKRYDGQAITCDDFINVMNSTYQTVHPNKSLAAFKGWYSQAGTPTIRVHTHYDPVLHHYTIRIAQQNKTVGIERLQTEVLVKEPLLIPIKVGLIGPEGQALHCRLNEHTADEFLLELDTAEQSWTFKQVTHPPVLSILRDFSAPVEIEMERSDQELQLLAEHDANAFGRWEAIQTLTKRAILNAALHPDAEHSQRRDAIVKVYQRLLLDPNLSPAFLARALSLASTREIQSLHHPMQPVAVAMARQDLQRYLGKTLSTHWHDLYQSLNEQNAVSYSPDALSAGRRALKNLCLYYLTAAQTAGADELAIQQYHQAQNMTDRFSALQSLVNHYDESLSGEACAHFYESWQHDQLVVDRWFSLQACAPSTKVESVRSLMLHPAFTLRNPNRARALIFQFCIQNSIGVHSAAGYQFWAEQVVALDSINPEIAARLARTFDNWSQYAEPYRSQLREAVLYIQTHSSSANVAEIVNKALTL